MDDVDRGGDKPEDDEARKKATALLKQIAEAVKMPQELRQFAFEQIAGDPYTIFLYAIWETPEGLEDS